MNTATTVEREFYSCPIRLDGSDRYLLWYSGPRDGVWFVGESLLTWRSDSALRDYAEKRNIEVSTEQTPVYDLDRVEDFIRFDIDIGAKEMLDTWNLFVDIASSVGAADFLAVERQQLDVYNHLFYLTDAAPIKNTHPECLTAADGEAVRKILSLGIAVLRQHIYRYQPPVGDDV